MFNSLFYGDPMQMFLHMVSLSEMEIREKLKNHPKVV
jgi:hypothetical protein